MHTVPNSDFRREVIEGVKRSKRFRELEQRDPQAAKDLAFFAAGVACRVLEMESWEVVRNDTEEEMAATYGLTVEEFREQNKLQGKQ